MQTIDHRTVHAHPGDLEDDGEDRRDHQHGPPAVEKQPRETANNQADDDGPHRGGGGQRAARCPQAGRYTPHCRQQDAG